MKTIILGTAHLKSTPGKCSPDKRLKEYEYSRKVCKTIKSLLENTGYKVFIDIEDDDLNMNASQELSYRCNIVNSLQKKYKNCIYIYTCKCRRCRWKLAYSYRLGSLYVYRYYFC